jgi:hypothetical protein
MNRLQLLENRNHEWARYAFRVSSLSWALFLVFLFCGWPLGDHDGLSHRAWLHSHTTCSIGVILRRIIDSGYSVVVQMLLLPASVLMWCVWVARPAPCFGQSYRLLTCALHCTTGHARLLHSRACLVWCVLVILQSTMYGRVCIGNG